jgi:hypothetical protein
MKKLVACLVLAGCLPSVPPPTRFAPPEEYTDAATPPDPAALACEKLRGWGCQLGQDPFCGDVFRLPPGYGFDPWGVLSAPTPDALPPQLECLK